MPDGITIVADLAAYFPLMDALIWIVANTVTGALIIRLDRRTVAVKRERATYDGVRGFMVGGVPAAVDHSLSQLVRI
jgi:hypothetical protein